jgi:hypothetical protein
MREHWRSWSALPVIFGLGLLGCSTDPAEAANHEPAKAPPAAADPAPSAQPAQSAQIVPPKPVAAPPRPRLYAKTRFVWIKSEPGSQGWIGFLWTGGSVELRDEAPRAAGGCATRWYPIEPRGWVCADGQRATLDANDPGLAQIRPYAPKLDSPWLHEYGESRGLQRYTELPTPEQQRRREWDLPDHLARIERARTGDVDSSLAGVDLTPAKPTPIELAGLPPTIREPRRRLLPLSTLAWSAETFAQGRSWLLSADFMWVPKDRVVPYPKVSFRGLRLGVDAKLPVAFFRIRTARKYERAADGTLVATDQNWQRLSWVELTGNTHEQAGETYLETRQAKQWLKRSEAVLPVPQATTPWGAPVGGSDTAAGPAGRRTWMEASVWQGWLIAYEGTRPVYVTLIAPGRGGTPVRGKPAIDTASTPTGSFKITGKFATATMEAPGEFIHSDVPWAQNFSGPHALHGAYWHNEWGQRMSAGCVNASPVDGKWLFDFTEPRVPEGWHGVRWLPSVEPATTFVVHD